MRLQSIESAIRSAILRGAVAVARGPRPAALPDWSSGPFRVLMVRDDGLGDMIVSLAVMHAIVRAHPTIQLDVLASPQNALIARRAGFFHEVIEHRRGSFARSRKLWRLLRDRRYDAVIDGRVAVMSVNTQTTFLLLSTRAPWLIGIGGRRNAGVYTVPVSPSDTSHWIRYIAELAQPFGIDPQAHDWTPELALAEHEHREALTRWASVAGCGPHVLLNLSVGHPDRRWPDDRYAAVLARVRERLPHASIVVLAMPADRASADALAASVGGAAWSLSIEETIAAVATAQLVITPDTAVSHMAAAFRRVTLTLLRQGYDRWIPYGAPGRNVFGDDPRRLDALPAARVIAALDALIDECSGRSEWNTPPQFNDHRRTAPEAT